jgi:hypothetical protein
MRSSILAPAAFGLLVVTAIAAPFLPNDTLPDVAYESTSTAMPKVLNSGASTVQDVLSAAAFTSERQRSPIDFSNLIRIGDQDYDVRYSADFSDQVVSQHTVQKIGYGKKHDVTIITTESGTYSTDGLASRHVRYPDIDARRARSNSFDGLFGAIWFRGVGWMPTEFSPAHSVITFGNVKGGGRFISGDGSTCVTGSSYATCN